MGNLTTTGDSSPVINGTDFKIGDRVRSRIDGRAGVLVNPDSMIPTYVALPTPHIELRPSATPILPVQYAANPPVDRVKVEWQDGTSSVVSMRTLEKP